MKNFLLLGTITFVFAGCAASNGGGHVVGNSAIPANTAKKLAQGDTCACGKKHEAGAEHKSCSQCGDKKGKDSACTKCGTSECTCSH